MLQKVNKTERKFTKPLPQGHTRACSLHTESRETNNKTGEAVVIGFQGKRAAVRS